MAVLRLSTLGAGEGAESFTANHLKLDKCARRGFEGACDAVLDAFYGTSTLVEVGSVVMGSLSHCNSSLLASLLLRRTP
jgi:hypothetical protein